MARPQTDGRMINKDISDSDGYARLRPESAVLFSMLIPHYNSHGKMNGGVAYIKEIVCPKVPYLTLDNIAILLQDITDNTNVKWFEHGGRWWIHSLNFLTDHQKLKASKLGQDKMPSYKTVSNTTPELVQTKSGLTPNYSGTSPELVPPEVEVEVEVEVEEEGISGLNSFAENIYQLILTYYPKSGQQVGVADGQAETIFRDLIVVADHGPLLQAVKNYAASERVQKGFVLDLPKFFRDDYWRNWITVAPSGGGTIRAADRDAEQEIRDRQEYQRRVESGEIKKPEKVRPAWEGN